VGPGEREQGIYASMCHCVVHPDGRAEVALAGHPRPIVMDGTAGGPIEVEARGPILGLLAPPSWPVTQVTIPHGGLLVLYTDGLLEARQGDEIFGSARVVTTLAEGLGMPLEARIAFLTERARRYDSGNLRDDVSVIAVQRMATPPR
jgi:hypothetical protein